MFKIQGAETKDFIEKERNATKLEKLILKKLDKKTRL
jgi:hypothetical protein